MSLKSGIAAMLVVMGSTAAMGQAQPSSADTVATKEEVVKLLELTQARSRVVQMLDGMAKQARMGAEQGFRMKVPDATPEQIKRVDEFSDTIFAEFSPDEVIDAIVPIYQKHLSKSDLDAIVAFYSSPAGQRVLKEMPAILSESMEAGGKIGRSKMESVNWKIEEQIDAMVREAQDKRDKDQKRTPAKN
jgi:uncharacterized protein